jgi:hypothetical protein
MNQPTMSPYPDSQMQQQSALIDPFTIGANEAICEAIPAVDMPPVVTPMPPEFELIHPRRVRCSGFFTQPDGGQAHYTGYRKLTPEDEADYRLNDPENGLHPDDLKAFRASIRSPAERGLMARLLAQINFRRSGADT